MTNDTNTFLNDCDAQMDHYSSKGLVTHLARQRKGASNLTYRFKWHMGRFFDLVADSKNKKLTFSCLLPGVDKKSVIDADIRAFIKSQTGPDIAEHRRLAEDPKNVRLINRKGSISLSVAAENDNASVLVERMIGIGHQVYTQFLRKGGYDEYLVEVFDIDLDTYM
jgi:hypothetical protein